MSDRGVTFAGNGGMDVGDGNMKDVRSSGLNDSGVVQGPKGLDPGRSASGEIVNEEGSIPSGGEILSPVSDW